MKDEKGKREAPTSPVRDASHAAALHDTKPSAETGDGRSRSGSDASIGGGGGGRGPANGGGGGGGNTLPAIRDGR